MHRTERFPLNRSCTWRGCFVGCWRRSHRSPWRCRSSLAVADEVFLIATSLQPASVFLPGRSGQCPRLGLHFVGVEEIRYLDYPLGLSREGESVVYPVDWT